MKKFLILCVLLLAALLSGCRRAIARANSRKHTESSNATGRNACFL